VLLSFPREAHMQFNKVHCCATAILLLLITTCTLSAQEAAAHRKRIGVALSGGGALGLAHIGVLKYLDEHHIPVDAIAGTSMGGLIGGLYATGHDAVQIEDIARHAKWSDLFRATPKFEDRPVAEKQQWNRTTGDYTFRFGKRLALPAGINPGQQLALLLSRETLGYSEISSFDDLPIPFRCVATDLVAEDEFILDHGSLPKALRATMALPAVFTPVEWDGRVLIDGGIVNNLPTDVVRAMNSDVVIAVSVERLPIPHDHLNTLTNILRQSANIAVLQNERRNLKLADIAIPVPLGDTESTDFEKAQAIIDIGYRAAQQNAAALDALALPPEQWTEYVNARKSRIRHAAKAGPLLEVKSSQPEIEESGSHELFRKSGESTSEKELEENLTGMIAATSLPSAFYEWTNVPGQEGFQIDLEPRPNRELLLRPSLFYQVSNGDTNRFTLRLEGAGIPQDAYKSRYLAALSVGYDPGARFEYYQPFDGSPYFIAPGMVIQRTHMLDFTGPVKIDNTRDRFAASSYFGMGTWRNGQVRIGGMGGFDDYSERLTTDGVTARSTAFINPEIAWTFNNQDSGELPTRGTRINGSSGWSFRDHSYPYLQSDFDSFWAVSPSTSLFALGATGSSFGRKLSFYDQFTTGGLTSLDAYRYQEFHANTLVTGGGGIMYRGLRPETASFRPFFATWYEAGRLDLGSQGWRTAHSASLGVFAPTPAGLAGLTLSFNEKGHARFRFSLGTFWNRP
jgi:NTE family protein